MSPELLSALASGAIVVTPNRRIARVLQQAYDIAQFAAGRRTWASARILPYSVWLPMLWEEAIAVDAVATPPMLLSPAQTGLLWEQVVEADASPLLDRRGAARLATQAWATFHGWRLVGESWRAWRRSADDRDDPAEFASWADTYAAAASRAGAIDMAQLPDELGGLADRVAAWRRHTVFAGFVEFTPQQEGLLATLSAAGARLQNEAIAMRRASVAVRVGATTPYDELTAALVWARARALVRPEAHIGIVVEDLAQRRDEVLSMAQDILSPSTLVPGALTGRLPFEISLGVPLAQIPIVRAALDLIALAGERMPSGVAAAVLRSPYLPGAERQWPRRAAIERDWLEEGRGEVTLADAIDALEHRAPELTARWRAGRDALRSARATTPREHVDLWRAWLAAAGWPGTRALDSGEYQAREAWDGLLGEFASLGAVAKRLDFSRAQAILRGLADERIFQPEGSASSVNILGVLEASGIEFDSLWVAGLSADRWPPAPRPDPLLPLRWQRERDVPRSSARRELGYAQSLITGFACAAPEVVFSSAASDGDTPMSPSTLIMTYPSRALPPPTRTWAQAIAESATLEAVADDRAPPLAQGSAVRGGARVVQSQSDCPFQAMARHRLDAEPWPSPLAGLSAQERGTLVHATLAAFWETVRDHAALAAMGPLELSAAIGAAVHRGLGELPTARWRGIAELISDGEERRLAAILGDWLALERQRPSFAVKSVEATSTLSLAGLAFRIRFDRVDALADGGVAILDYKTGRAVRPQKWFEARPRASQLGMYTLAQRAAEPELSVRAVAYAQLRPDEVAAYGIAADSIAWPVLAPANAIGQFSGWSAIEAWWNRHLGALATEIAQGDATVAPRASPLACRSCRLQPLCRIETLRAFDDHDANDD